jgi:dephospho-CoA kinase
VTSVGLTGSIGSGKTTVGAMFVELGCRLIDSDTITHELLSDDGGVCDAVVREFGAAVLGADRRIDRKKLGTIVFDDPVRRRALTDILHPVIFVRQQAFLDKCAQEDPACIAIVDAALMVETGNARRFDTLVVVICTEQQQRARLRGRGLSDEDITVRIAAQMSMNDKVKHADYVIDSSGTVGETRRQVEEVQAKLLESRK